MATRQTGHARKSREDRANDKAVRTKNERSGLEGECFVILRSFVYCYSTSFLISTLFSTRAFSLLPTNLRKITKDTQAGAKLVPRAPLDDAAYKQRLLAVL